MWSFIQMKMVVLDVHDGDSLKQIPNISNRQNSGCWIIE